MTAQAWGALVRGMFPGYAGYRPRLQLWHGTADATINYDNQTQAILEWTNVLGLSATPGSTDTTSTSGFTIEKWQSSCGFTVLEAHTQQGGGHTTPIDAGSVIGFFGLAQATGPDPEIAACGGSTSGSGGSTDAGEAGKGSADASGSGGFSGGSSTGSSSGSSGGASTGSSSGSSGGSGRDPDGGSEAGSSTGSSGGRPDAASGSSGSQSASGGGADATSGPGSGSAGEGGDDSTPSGGGPGADAEPSGSGCGVSPGGGSETGGAAVAACLAGIALSGRRRRCGE